MKSLVLAVAIGVAGLIVALLVYLGAFKEAHLTEGEAGPFRMVYKHHVGAYHKVVPTMEEVEKWAAANGESCQFSFGEYIDDPNLVDEDRLNSNVGCVVTRDWSSGLPEGYLYREIPRRLYVLVEFDGAPSIGPFKTYPKAQEYIAQKELKSAGPVIEIYERLPQDKVKTRYHFAIEPKSD